MAEDTAERLAHDDERTRPKGRGPSLAEEMPDELPALLAFAVGIAIIVVILGAGYVRPDRSTGTEAVVETTETTEAAEEEPEPEPEPEEVEVSLDVPALDAEIAGAGFEGVSLSADGAEVTVTGELPDEPTQADLLAFVGGLAGVESVVDATTIAAPAVEGPDVDVAASQAQVVLTGIVPSQELSDEIAGRAATIYDADQIDNQLVVDAGVEPPISVSIRGTLTDPVLFNSLTNAFSGIVGVEAEASDEFVLEESSELETSLNDLEPIQFSSGSSVILADSEPILDQAAEFLNANPDVSIEVGGHTDSIGEEESNQRLSLARANSVLDALRARGVENEIVARGFGERRLKIDPDDTAEAQQENRRIEFRII
ncbi:MAG: OmpA family protein [Actinomycetota bacterium]